MRTFPLGPSVELPVGRDLCDVCAEMGGGTPREPFLWCRLPVGHGPYQGCADMGWVAGCEPCFWGCRLSSLRGTIHVRGESK